jgi:hypothetical protein
LIVPVIWPVAVWALTVPAVLSIASTAPKMASFFISEVSSSKQQQGEGLEREFLPHDLLAASFFAF